MEYLINNSIQQSQGYNYNTGFDHCFEIDDPGALKHKAITPQDMAKAYGMTIEVNPNPAATWAAFDYRLPETAPTAQLEITDLSGNKVHSIELKGLQGQYMLDTRTLANGMYLYTVTCGKATKTGKLIISK